MAGSPRLAALQRKHPDDVVITMAIRSPLCKAKKGGFRDMRSDELLTEMFRQAIKHSNIDAGIIEDICVGTVLAKGPTYEARTAALAAGIPERVPIQTLNRFCSSGLIAVTTIANEIRAGQIDVGLAVGVESMSWNPDVGPESASTEIKGCGPANDALQPMGWTSENVAGEFSISREDMDDFAAKSFQRAEAADKAGYFSKEIVPFSSYQNDPVTGARKKVIVSKDDGIRYGTTKSTLLKIKSAFPKWPPAQTTGGNASQITDGAAAVLLMTRRRADELGLRVLAKYANIAISGLAPRIMGIGPTIAIPKVLEKVGLVKEDVDLFEINEAFASMCVYCVRKLELDPEKVNVNGGAIAFGHPLDELTLRATGARQIATGLNELERRGGKVLVTSMCMGTGMGAAAVFLGEFS
ncbi:thiolase [Multifurca ochricompacta]|uniref:Thiolase n=1 Tax=Multifurca ochricompacta TaxID=376703 RepID=A0AAD4MFB8_9AGAM|nr:thiolase [Multifurca ochricompacta]